MDDVVIGVPYEVERALLDQLRVSVVVHGSTPISDSADPYRVPRDMQIFRTIDTGNRTTTETIIERIIANRMQYEARNQRKLGAKAEEEQRLRDRQPQPPS